MFFSIKLTNSSGSAFYFLHQFCCGIVSSVNSTGLYLFLQRWFSLTISNPLLCTTFPTINPHQSVMATTSSSRTSRWNYSSRFISIDRKLFSIAFDTTSRGSKAKITEKGQSSSYTISVSWKSLNWLSTSFNTLANAPAPISSSPSSDVKTMCSGWKNWTINMGSLSK